MSTTTGPGRPVRAMWKAFFNVMATEGKIADWQPYADFLCTFIGFGAHQGFWWSGGGHDPNSTQTPIALRFKRPGRQVIRLHALETPLQIDTIWLSTTKTTRPGPEEAPGKR